MIFRASLANFILILFLNLFRQEVLFNVEDVQATAGYILHIGETDQPVRRGMEVELHIDKVSFLFSIFDHLLYFLINEVIVLKRSIFSIYFWYCSLHY